MVICPLQINSLDIFAAFEIIYIGIQLVLMGNCLKDI